MSLLFNISQPKPPFRPACVQYCPSPARIVPDPWILAAQYPSYGSSEEAIPSRPGPARQSIFFFFLGPIATFWAKTPAPPDPAGPRARQGATAPPAWAACQHYPGNPQVARPAPVPARARSGIRFRIP